ncbi:MAG TPA: MFS transporter [Candidatus Saccharimonadales bacterium]|nr:MFS transporter [Candidatus Saccharimonadales bacterium]
MTKEKHSYKITLLVLAFTAFVLGTAELMIVGILNPIADSLHVSVGTAGQLVTGYALGIAIGSPILTALTNKLGRRTLVIAAVVVYVLSSAMVLLSTSYSIFLIARILAGVMHGMIIGSSFSIASQVVPAQKRGQAIGIVFGGLSVATVLGVPLGTLAGQLLGWQAAFIAVVIMGVAALAGLMLFLPNTNDAGQLSLKDQSRSAFTPGVFITLFAGLLIMGGQFTLLTYLEPFLTNTTHIHGGMVSAFLFAYGTACAVGTFIGGKLADKNPSKTIIVANALLIGIFILLHVVGGQGALVALLLLCWGFVGFGLVPSYQLYVIGLAGKGANLASTLGVSAVNVGVAVGAVAGGTTISMLHSSSAVPLTAAVVCAVALPVSLFAGKRFWHKPLGQAAPPPEGSFANAE